MSNFILIALIIVTPLLIALFIAGFSIRKNRSLIGFFVGLLPIYAPWPAPFASLISACIEFDRKPGKPRLKRR